jgi:hypothetical protein
MPQNSNKAQKPMPPLNPNEPNQSPLNDEGKAESPADLAASPQEPDVPEFVTLGNRHWVLTDLLRVLLIALSLAVAGALILMLLPQSAFDGLIQNLQARHAVAQPEQIAFLYLGDETANNELRIRGVVRNITAVQVEQLDAIIRLYAHDRSLLETTVIRMSKDTIDPGAIAQFELVYPNYGSQFGSYSVEFKLRQGSIVPYKDMRTFQERSR